jgi:hypothetical protein
MKMSKEEKEQNMTTEKLLSITEESTKADYKNQPCSTSQIDVKTQNNSTDVMELEQA